MNDDGCQWLVDAWATEVRELVPALQRQREEHRGLVHAADGVDAFGPTEHDVYESFCRLWATEHRLVWTAYQLERWTRRRARDLRRKVPRPDPVLAQVRNALEHLEGVSDGLRKGSLRSLRSAHYDCCASRRGRRG